MASLLRSLLSLVGQCLPCSLSCHRRHPMSSSYLGNDKHLKTVRNYEGFGESLVQIVTDRERTGGGRRGFNIQYLGWIDYRQSLSLLLFGASYVNF